MPMLHQHLWVSLMDGPYHIASVSILSICISRMSICVTSCVYVIFAQISDSGDAVEAIAIKTLFSEHATSGALALSSTKVNIQFQIKFSF